MNGFFAALGPGMPNTAYSTGILAEGASAEDLRRLIVRGSAGA